MDEPVLLIALGAQQPASLAARRLTPDVLVPLQREQRFVAQVLRVSPPIGAPLLFAGPRDRKWPGRRYAFQQAGDGPALQDPDPPVRDGPLHILGVALHGLRGEGELGHTDEPVVGQAGHLLSVGRYGLAARTAVRAQRNLMRLAADLLLFHFQGLAAHPGGVGRYRAIDDADAQPPGGAHH